MSKTRKIQLTGKSTFIVSLPKAWATKNNLAQGQELHLDEMPDGTLKIGTQKSEKKKLEMNLHIDTGSIPSELARTLLSGYLNGFDIVNMRSKKPFTHPIRKTVVDCVDRLIGYEIVDEKPEHMMIQDFFSQAGLSIEKTLKRSHMIASNMQQEFAAALEERQAYRLKEIMEQEDEVDRLTFLIQRQLRRAMEDSAMLEVLHLPAQKVIELYITCSRVERIADSFYRNAQELIDIPTSISSNGALSLLLEANRFTYEMHTQAMLAFYENDKKTANKLLDEHSAFMAKKTETMKRMLGFAKVEPLALTILTRYYDVANLGRDIAEIVLDIPHAQNFVDEKI
ncbi:phosphate uptake regulator PhoU [Candidatus Parvarchaeota archaeon]|nr:phosphate uptake regulator PhoU [Candidatus Parvarchaeota archaeon]